MPQPMMVPETWDDPDAVAPPIPGPAHDYGSPWGPGQSGRSTYVLSGLGTNGIDKAIQAAQTAGMYRGIAIGAVLGIVVGYLAKTYIFK
jgi:hypothetical protein